ncbi:MerR family transcriptional regulator [Brevibacterium sp. K11IcPPYGO002]|uniref:MerR family transcriptional regulator n=1 Tax=Brevibacterium sp. K11IcPPYGO002 TaxID=3058837 RepID=UPI003D815EB8
MKISEVSERTGVPASTLRYYERLGILQAGRSPNGYRDFDDSHLERLDFIAAAKRLGLELPEIRRLLELADDGTCTGVKAALQPLLAEQIAAVERQLRVLAQLQEQLREARDHVDGCPDSDEPCRSECAFRAFAGSAVPED